MAGNFFITIGYNRGRPNQTHGWAMFGEGCVTAERQIMAVSTMLNIMGFEAPEEITPPPEVISPAIGGTPQVLRQQQQSAAAGAPTSPAAGGSAPAPVAPDPAPVAPAP